MMLTLGSFTLLPLRLIILIPSFIFIWCSSSLGLLGMDEDKPASGFRRRLLKFNYFVSRFIVRVCFGFLSPKISSDLLSTEVTPILVVAPHTAMFDFWVICWFSSGDICSAMVRDEDMDTMFLGTILRFQQIVFVRRSSKTSKQEALTTFSSQTEEKHWVCLVIFPEGTTSDLEIS